MTNLGLWNKYLGPLYWYWAISSFSQLFLSLTNVHLTQSYGPINSNNFILIYKLILTDFTTYFSVFYGILIHSFYTSELLSLSLSLLYDSSMTAISSLVVDDLVGVPGVGDISVYSTYNRTLFFLKSFHVRLYSYFVVFWSSVKFC